MKNSCLNLSLLLLIAAQQASAESAQILNQTQCLNKCGHVEIPYPFGTSLGCYLNSNFLMSCISDTSGQPPRLFFGNSYTLEVINLSINGHLTVLTSVGKDCYYPNGSRVEALPLRSLGTLSYFPLSFSLNKFFVVGCNTRATISAWDRDDRRGCVTKCGDESLNGVAYDRTCSGFGCCQTTIPSNVLKSKVSVTSYRNHISLRRRNGNRNRNRCSYVFVAESNYLEFSQHGIVDLKNVKKVPTVLDWSVGFGTCESVQHALDYACGNNSECVDSSNGLGYRCSCLKGYEGNPYMPDGCQDIDECSATPNLCGDNECSNTIGNYICHCKDGYEGNAIRGGGGCGKVQKIVIDNIVGKLWKLYWSMFSRSISALRFPNSAAKSLVLSAGNWHLWLREKMARVYVGNLTPRVSERDLEDEFRVYGVLRSVWVARRPPGYAFIEFDDRRDAMDAIRALDGKNGWRVELSHNSKGGPGGGGGRGRGGGGGDDSKCYECGEPGHFARECSLRGASRGGGGRRSPSPRRRIPSPRRRSPSPRRRRSPSYGRSRSPLERKLARRDSISPRRVRSYSRSPPPYRRNDSPIPRRASPVPRRGSPYEQLGSPYTNGD